MKTWLLLAASLWAAAPAIAAPLRWRVIEPWLDPAGKELFTHGGNMMTWSDLQHISPDTPLGRYIRWVAAEGFNGMALYCDPDDNPAAFRAFLRYLQPRGIRVFIRHDWNEIEIGRSWPIVPSDPAPRASRKLNPFDPGVRAYWRQRIARDYAQFPEIAGYRMSGTEFYFDNGAPWMGEGVGMAAKSGRECVIAALDLIAGALAPHGGTVVWETCQDDAWGQRQELWYFRDLTGAVPDNAFILIKDHYWDYHPGWPAHPLDYVIRKDREGRSPYITSVQLPGEYMGVNDFPWCQVAHLSEVMRTAEATGQQGLWVVDNPLGHEPWDHPLNLVNWYGVRALMRDPRADPDRVIHAWAASRYGEAAADTVAAVVRDVSDAARGAFEFDALFSAAHSRFPTLSYLDSHLCGPLRRASRMKGMMGLVLPLDMYPPEVEAALRANPATRLVFNQVPITPELKRQAMAQKDGAVAAMRRAVAAWATLRGKIAESDYAPVAAGLELNLNDARAFAAMMRLYMDWKLGQLTEEEIDATLAAEGARHGAAVPWLGDPHPASVTVVEPASLKTFAEELRGELRHPALEQYWRDHPNPHVTYLIPPSH